MNEYDLPLICKFCEGTGKGYVLTEKESGGTYWKVVSCWHCDPDLELEQPECVARRAVEEKISE